MVKRKSSASTHQAPDEDQQNFNTIYLRKIAKMEENHREAPFPKASPTNIFIHFP